MGNICQFCGENPNNFLQKFSRGWVCDICLLKYDLISHNLLANEIEINCEEEAITKGMHDYYNDCGWGWGWDSTPYKQGLGWYNKPKKCTVLIEELECDPNDLSSATKFVMLVPTSKKIINKAKRWLVEFLPL